MNKITEQLIIESTKVIIFEIDIELSIFEDLQLEEILINFPKFRT